MKRFIISLLLICGFTTIYAQTIVNKYNQAMWDNNANDYRDKPYDVYITFNNDKVEYIIMKVNLSDKNVKFATVRLTNNADLDNLIKSLKSIRNKFRHWIETAEKNKVTDFKKQLTDIYDMPQMTAVAMLEDGKSYTGEHIFFKPIFSVNDKGKINLIMAMDLNMFRLTPSKYSAADVIKDFSLFTLVASTIPTKEYERFHRLGFTFSSVEQIQSLIDALDCKNKINDILQKKQSDKLRNDSIDKLFK